MRHGLMGRVKLWLTPARKKHCHGVCLVCRWYTECRQELSEKEWEVKNGKRPTLEQKKILRSHGLQPDMWLVVRGSKDAVEVVSRKELARCEMARISGQKKKPRTRVLRRED